MPIIFVIIQFFDYFFTGKAYYVVTAIPFFYNSYILYNELTVICYIQHLDEYKMANKEIKHN